MIHFIVTLLRAHTVSPDMKATSSLCALFLILVSVTAVDAVNKQPECSSFLSADEHHETCSLWFHEYFVVAGRDYKVNEPIGWQDVVIPFTQHDRRAFPLWNRFHFFTPVPEKPYEFLFVPSFMFPLDCHKTHYNLHVDPITQNTTMSPKPTTIRAMKAGDPFYRDCSDEDLSVDVLVEDFPDFEQVVENGTCLDGLQVGPSTLPNVGRGAFATKSFNRGETLMFGPMFHMHRSELMNQEDNGSYEELLNYCFGHAQTSILLLPGMPIVNAMNHKVGNQANVAMRNDMSIQEMQDILDASKAAYLENFEYSQIYVKYVALCDIQPGDELFMDYGQEWQTAWEERDLTQPFRHEIGLDRSFFPQQWLDNQVKDEPFPDLDLETLQPGQVSRVKLMTGQELGQYLHRVGLPRNFTAKLNQWSEDMGITRVMQDLILNGKGLKKDGQERVRINGGTWWIKRFDGNWQSNMHYITPDDDASNEQFMVALGEAGFDQVLAGIGHHFDLKRLSCFYASFIAVSHCVYSYMHSDSDYDKVWNLIFPILQMNTTDAEINLGSDVDVDTSEYPLVAPYKYETDAGVLLGKDGFHGTAPTDYRGLGGMRLVASVYMGDFDDSFVDSYVEEWNDPPYPRRNYLRNALMQRSHWKAGDPNLKVGSPQAKLLAAGELREQSARG